MKQSRVGILAETSMLIALGVALSFVKLWRMPMGGSVTLASMLPIMMIGIRHGYKWGLGGAFVYALFQLLQALIEGDVFPYCQTVGILLLCIAFDYIVPFTMLGLSGVFRHMSVGKSKHFGIYLGMTAVVFVRFVCHFVTGVAIWGQWAPEGMSAVWYSIGYNGTFLLPDFAIALVIGILFNERVSRLGKLFVFDVDKSE